MPDTQFCRLCASKCERYVKIFEEEGQKLNLVSKITQCLQIWLYPEDVLPKTVCNECCTKLDDYFEFFESCSQSQLSLMTIFNEEVDEKKTDILFELKDDNKCGELDDLGRNDVGNDRTDDDSVGVGSDLNGDDLVMQDQVNGDRELQLNQTDFGDSSNGGDNVDYSTDNSGSNSKNLTLKRKLRMPFKRSSKQDSKTNIRKIISKVCAKIKINVGKQRTNQKHILAKNIKIKKPKLVFGNNVKTVGNCSKNTLSRKDVDLEFMKENEENYEEYDADSQTQPDNTDSHRKIMESYKWKCTDCPVELKTLSALKEHHLGFHNQPPNFKCSQCCKVYTRYRSFARHIKLHGDPKKYSCEVCGKSFSQKTVLQSHSTVHSEERPHTCPQCGKAFKQFSSLYLHSKCHLPDHVKPKFPCTVCIKSFSSKHTLEMHMKIHTGERNYICDVCGKSFIAKGSLDYHILTHNDAKPHSCPVCGKSFKTVRLLTKHSTLHTGIKPHQCDVCGKQFRERSSLREHNRIHTGAMPYSCEYCGKLFRFKGILTVHRRLHTGERPYSCTDCKRDFTNWANYNKHMKRRHRSVENHTNGTNGETVQVNMPPRIMLRQPHATNVSQGVQTSFDSQLNTLHDVHTPAEHLLSVTQSELPAISVQQLPPVNGLQLHMQPSVVYNDNTSSANTNDSINYKLLPSDEQGAVNNVNSELYRVSHYITPQPITSVSYYLPPPIHQSILQSRNH